MDLDSHERYELRSVLERGIIRSIDYRKVRVWHRLSYLDGGFIGLAQPAPAGAAAVGSRLGSVERHRPGARFGARGAFCLPGN